VKRRRRKKNVSAGPLDVTPAIRKRIGKGLAAAAAPHVALAKEGVRVPKGNPAFDKDALRKDIARDQRRAAKEKRERLKSEVFAARKAARGAKGTCKAARRVARERFADARGVREDARSKRETARVVCGGVADAAARVKAARAKLVEEIKFQRDMRRIEAGNRAKARRDRASARERRSESDDEVRANIPDDLVPLFNRVRGQIKGSARKSRTEAFLEYAEQHPQEAHSNEAVDAEVDRLIAELRERDSRENPAAPIVVDPRHGELVSLGLLTKIRTTRGVIRFSLRRAPVLAYHLCRGKCDVAKRLVVVMRARSSKGVRPTSKEARREYERAHWGDKGSRPSIPGRVYAGGAVRIVGTIRSVVYTTKKGGDAELTDYDHAFENARPVLGKSGGLFVIMGGSYRVEPRGIVG
jgi:hypothetical protein